MRLGGRRVLVTGAASGIGLATVQLFMEEGASVTLVDVNEEALGRALRTLEAPVARVRAVPCDVTDPAQVAHAVSAGAAAFGGLDGVVNSAGADLMARIEETSLADWQRTLALNLTGPFLVCRAALPALRAAGGGTIVSVASGAGLRPLPERTAYCAAKAGLVMFSKTLALEVAADGIRVNCVCPGIVETPMFRASYERAANPTAERARIEARYALGRAAEPREIAHACLYLTSAESSFVTGIALAVDGGRTFH